MQLAMGPGEALDITAVTGLESSELEISTCAPDPHRGALSQ